MNIFTDLDRATQLLLRSPALQDHAALHALAAAFNWWGGAGVIWFTAIVWLGSRALRHRGLAEFGLRGAEALTIASAISGIVKGLAGRSRPFLVPGEPWHWDFAHGWTDARFFSMPSGHTTAAFAVASAMTVVAVRFRPRTRVALTAALFASALLVGFARMYFDQHWLSDTLAGAFLGGATGFAIARLHATHRGSAFDRVMLGRPPDGAWQPGVTADDGP
ncbi:MAG TPA: phosphatase PAP2 family protein [Gemmatimonadaceae bacterium]|nr:phosphatase PAP2 family protein [Gemmatimonadaceae bacterium]